MQVVRLIKTSRLVWRKYAMGVKDAGTSRMSRQLVDAKEERLA